MEAIDNALVSFNLILEEVKQYQPTIFSEQDTRLKIVNRIITDVLG